MAEITPTVNNNTTNSVSSVPVSSSPPLVINNGSSASVKVDSEDNKTAEYIRDLLQEKQSVDVSACPNAFRLVDQEVARVQAGGKPSGRESKYVDIYREKPIRVTVKVLVPVKEHPKFNFVGKLLGPKGNSMKRLQEETMTKMAVLGRGSMRDKQKRSSSFSSGPTNSSSVKEEELRASLDPKYQHLNDELHVEITAFAPPAEAHARLAYALAEVRKYLIPDNNDEIRQEQMREMELLQNGETNGAPGPGGGVGVPTGQRRAAGAPAALGGLRGRGGRGLGAPPPLRGALRGMARGGRGGLLSPPPGPVAPRGGPPVPPGVRKAPPPPLLPRPTPTKQKVLSILERARVAMEESYGFEEENYYDYDAFDSVGYGYEDYEESGGEYYDSDTTGARWKPFKAPGGMDRARFRPSPYARPK